MRFESSVLSVVYPIGDHGVLLSGLLSVMPHCLLRRRVAPLSVALLRVAPLRMAPLRVAPLSVAPLSVAPLRMAPLRVAPLRVAPLCASSPDELEGAS